jgi:hypothetical protein
VTKCEKLDLVGVIGASKENNKLEHATKRIGR